MNRVIPIFVKFAFTCLVVWTLALTPFLLFLPIALGQGKGNGQGGFLGPWHDPLDKLGPPFNEYYFRPETDSWIPREPPNKGGLKPGPSPKLPPFCGSDYVSAEDIQRILDDIALEAITTPDDFRPVGPRPGGGIVGGIVAGGGGIAGGIIGGELGEWTGIPGAGTGGSILGGALGGEGAAAAMGASQGFGAGVVGGSGVGAMVCLNTYLYNKGGEIQGEDWDKWKNSGGYSNPANAANVGPHLAPGGACDGLTVQACLERLGVSPPSNPGSWSD